MAACLLLTIFVPATVGVAAAKAQVKICAGVSWLCVSACVCGGASVRVRECEQVFVIERERDGAEMKGKKERVR